MAKYNEINECLDETMEISIEDFVNIIKEENISELVTYFSKKCNNDNEKYLVEKATIYLDLFKEYLRINNIISQDKTKTVYQISSLWMYSDWILENSWFDLISDIEEIDKIIFSEVIEYKWEDYWNTEKIFEEELYNAVKKWTENLNENIDNLLGNNENKEYTDKYNIPLNIIPTPLTDSLDITDSTSNYVCADDEKKSWLNDESLDYLINKIENPVNSNWNLNIQSSYSWENTWWNQNNNSDLWNENIDENYLEELESEYVKVVDNSQWPCEDFFCIIVEFITNDNGNSSEKVTIEYLLKRSNEHLAKFASTSLIQAQFSTNQFQLWLADLNLPDIFHLWIQIVRKPIPILNIEKVWKKDNSQYSWSSLLEEYYRLNWLNYQRRNSLVLLERLEQNKQNINNSVWLTTDRILHKNSEYNNIKNAKNTSEILTKLVWKKASLWSIKNFEEQFSELNKFMVTMNDYIENLKSIIIKINEIPIVK